jgi:endonuclease/exonuclease/phosphatase family metal-dependent hydrolase
VRGSVRGGRFTVSGSHLATDPAERPAQAALWKEALDAIEGPVIAAADLNEGPGGGAWRTVEDGLVSSDGRAGSPFRRHCPPGSSTACSSPRHHHREVRGGGVGLARQASDHLPVLAGPEVASA